MKNQDLSSPGQGNPWGHFKAREEAFSCLKLDPVQWFAIQGKAGGM